MLKKQATSYTPQVVVIVMDDSGSMNEPCSGTDSKAKVASKGIRQLVMNIQADNVGGKICRYYLSLAKFGDDVTPLVEAQSPTDVRLSLIDFKGESGSTNMISALEWVIKAITGSLAMIRASVPSYHEERTPPPVVLFFSDGENTGPDVSEAAKRIHNVPFQGDKAMVVACGIGMKPEHFEVMRSIASLPELAANIAVEQLGEFIAEVGTSAVEQGEGRPSVVEAVREFRQAAGR
jgi:uncharacterized protein YegL